MKGTWWFLHFRKSIIISKCDCLLFSNMLAVSRILYCRFLEMVSISENRCFRSCTNLEALHILQGIPYIQYFPCTSKTWTYVNVFVRIRSRTPAFMPGAPKFWIFRGQKMPGTNGVKARNSKFWTYMNVFIGARPDFERARMCASCTSKPWTLALQIRNTDVVMSSLFS